MCFAIAIAILSNAGWACWSLICKEQDIAANICLNSEISRDSTQNTRNL